MRILYCYTSEPNPVSARSVLQFAPEAEWTATKTHENYNNVITEAWTGTEDLVVIEGDKEITAEVIPSFATCSEPWCCFSYLNFPAPYTEEIIIGMGCTKYSAVTQQKVPVEAINRKHAANVRCHVCNGQGCWRALDTRIATEILGRQISLIPHVHGRINHHHTYLPDWAQIRGLE